MRIEKMSMSCLTLASESFFYFFEDDDQKWKKDLVTTPNSAFFLSQYVLRQVI